MKVYHIDDVKKITSIITNSAVLKDVTPIAEIEDLDEIDDGCFEINNHIYTSRIFHPKNFVVVSEITFNDKEETETYDEDDITCPVCGSVESDCWEYSHDNDDNYICSNCGSILEWEREVKVTYTTKVKKRAVPIKIKELTK